MRAACVVIAACLAACGKSEPGSRSAGEAPSPGNAEPSAEARAAPTLDPALARLAPKERSGLFGRCPPADEAAEAAVAALGRAGAPCRAARGEAAACADFVARIERAVLDASGCIYAATPRPEQVRAPLVSPAPDIAAGLNAAVAAARGRAAAGQIDAAARLVARVVRTAVAVARGDDALAWVMLGELEPWSRALAAWDGQVSEEAAGLVRFDLKAAKAALLEVDFALRAVLVRDVERGTVGGGPDGQVFAEAALATLDALLDGAEPAAQEAEIAGLWEVNRAAIEALLAERGQARALTPKEHGLVVLHHRLAAVRALLPLVAAHARATAALERLALW